MLWRDHEPYAASSENHVMTDHLGFYREVVALRNAHPALRTGSFRTLVADDARDAWAFLREDASEQLLVAMTASEDPQHITLPAALGSGWRPVFGAGPEGAAPDRFPEVRLAPVSGRVWRRSARESMT
jgi:glycosidase